MNMPQDSRVVHPFDPVFGPDSRILILGTIPSVQSRRQGFYYANPQNRFWRVLECLLGEPVPDSAPERRSYLLAHRIALWDVLRACQMEGSQDASIRQPEVNDLPALLRQVPVSRIFTNGQAATRLYCDFCEPDTRQPCIALPSTSPANGRWSLAELCRAWQPVREALLNEPLQVGETNF